MSRVGHGEIMALGMAITSTQRPLAVVNRMKICHLIRLSTSGKELANSQPHIYSPVRAHVVMSLTTTGTISLNSVPLVIPV